MAGQQTRALRSPTGHRLVVSDNFYTRYTFAQACGSSRTEQASSLSSSNPCRWWPARWLGSSCCR
ncbi:hypothetical protein JG688_00008517 [Phytophthora aleatoria]|uniref:PiggyBac transposable element-derived protein domain-containing protein n=1 Tax=Phytophthora aleatoria TaxID=2496075 RepID=A0A8J5IR19_9STRA|nr:hypothetical protein JG688_00008517 [Phytophthora aleatoria]